jgi:hypothetical protein
MTSTTDERRRNRVCDAPSAAQGHRKPWFIVPYADGESLVIHSDADTRVCFMATPGKSPGAMERIEADARLIAAAPELLELLKAARGCLAIEGTIVGMEEGPAAYRVRKAMDRINALHAQMDAAIAKAEGRP